MPCRFIMFNYDCCSSILFCRSLLSAGCNHLHGLPGRASINRSRQQQLQLVPCWPALCTRSKQRHPMQCR